MTVLQEDVDFLAHYGVKGMKWGVVNDDDSAGDASTKKIAPIGKGSGAHEASKQNYLAEITKPKPKLNTKQAAEEYAANEEKSHAKIDGPPTKGSQALQFAKDHKKAIILGTAVVGLVAYSSYAQQTFIKNLPKGGEPIDLTTFKLAVSHSKTATWMGQGYIQPSSFERKEFSIPAGQTFYRLSTQAETSLYDGPGHGTYVTSSVADFNRYVAGFRGEKGPNATFYKVTFKATEEIRVPDLTTTLDSMKSVMIKSNVWSNPSDAEVIATYQRISGSPWSNELGKSLFDDLGKKGYGAIVDEMDAGVIGDRPLVFFKREATTPLQTKPMSKASLEKAEAAITELAARKTRYSRGEA